MRRTLRLAGTVVAVVVISSCQPKAEGDRYTPTIENRTDLILAVGWADGTMVGGDEINVDPHTTQQASFLSRMTCAKKVIIIQLVPRQAVDYRPPVKFSPDPWCYDEPLVITNA
jgi:hypothetical protein